ncbi:MAG: L,D-transpeptidase [Pseudomonadota bacterium]
MQTKDRNPRGRVARRSLVLGTGAALLTGALPVRARDVVFDDANMLPGEFTWHPDREPEGAVAVIVSLPEQLVHVYRNGVRIAVSTCSTGRAGHATPTGVFTILQKDKDHRSSTYNNAPMPNMNRLTWDGIALHAGNLPGYPASHGCVRLPLAFSEKLFTVTHIGTPVIIAGAASDPWELVHPGFVLGNFAEDEMADAVAALDARHHPSDWTDGQSFPVTTVLATGADRLLVLIENGDVIMESALDLTGDGPLGEHVFVLQDAGDQGLRWVGLTHHPDPTQPLRPERAVLERLNAPHDFNAALTARLHPGLTMIVSDLAATPDRRSGQDFVIMTGETLQSPRPGHRPTEPKTDQG